MKRLFISLIAVLALTTAASAQDNAFGVRFGAGSAFAAELSYQRFLSDVNRFELDFGMRLRHTYTYDTSSNSYQGTYPFGAIVSGIYQWHWFLAGGFGFYIGPGAQIAMASKSDHPFGIALGGQIGIDYQFDAPFQISLDFRPMYHLFGPFSRITVGHGAGFDPMGPIGLRYTF